MEEIFDNIFSSVKGFTLGCLTPIILVVALVLMFLSIAIVPAGSVGVVTHWGAVSRVIQLGLNTHEPIS